jgi:hypothetical protein
MKHWKGGGAMVRRHGSGRGATLLAVAAVVLFAVPATARSRLLKVTLEGPRLPARFLLGAEPDQKGLNVSEITVTDLGRNRIVCRLVTREGVQFRRIERWRYGEKIDGFARSGCEKPLRPGRHAFVVVGEEAHGVRQFDVKPNGDVVLVEP